VFVVGWLWKLLSRRMGGAGIVLWVMMCLVDAAMAERCCGWLVGMLEGWMYAMSCCGRMKRCGGCLWKGLSQMLERSYFLEDLPPSYRHVLKNSAVVMS
jgi:hypothetical protein